MIDLMDLIQREEFKKYFCQRIAKGCGNPNYAPPLTYPPLYKYRSLSKHAMSDVMSGTVTATAIGDFNDIFDGAIQQYGTQEEIDNAIDLKWEHFEQLRIAAGLADELLTRDQLAGMYQDYYKTESKIRFRMLDYLGMYVSCFSSHNDSTLMWAHYADENRGMCIEYDFNLLEESSIFRNLIYPVVYTGVPIDVSDLVEDKDGKVYPYPIDAAVMCTALNKASIWSYEHEWRMVCMLFSGGELERRLPLKPGITPQRVLLGYHFLKPFFYYNFKNNDEWKRIEKHLELFNAFLVYLNENEIQLGVMVPEIGNYRLKPQSIRVDSLRSFMISHFRDNRPNSIRYYNTVHDWLMDLLDKEN